MSLFGGLFHALTNPIGMITDPIGTVVGSIIESSTPSPPNPEDIG